MLVVCLVWKKLVHGILITVSILLVLLLLLRFALPAVSLAFSDDKGVCVPILMYHSLLKDPKRTGTYVVSPRPFGRICSISGKMATPPFSFRS